MKILAWETALLGLTYEVYHGERLPLLFLYYTAASKLALLKMQKEFSTTYFISLIERYISLRPLYIIISLN
jgi:hypothetical protein